MLRKLALSLLGGSALLGVGATVESRELAADGGVAIADQDGDFLPDVVEWVVLTSATNPDTDGDQISDFVEVVQRGRPRRVDEPMPLDQEMRIVVTGPQPGSVDQSTWLHLFVRIVGPVASMSTFSTWLELPALPGLRLGFDMLSFGQPVVNQRDAGAEGTWLSVSVPLVSPGVLGLLAPFSLNASSTIAGREIQSSVCLFDLQGSVCTLVPFDGASFAVQSLSTPVLGGGTLSNRVCLLDLTEVGSGPGGTVYEIAAARCDDCNEVECSPTCPQSIGWLVTIPGGLGTLTAR